MKTTTNKPACAPRVPRITYRQEGGDDGYSYVVRVDGRAIYDGLTQRSARGVKEALLRDYARYSATKQGGAS